MEEQAEICVELQRLEQQLSQLAQQEDIQLPASQHQPQQQSSRTSKAAEPSQHPLQHERTTLFHQAMKAATNSPSNKARQITVDSQESPAHVSPSSHSQAARHRAADIAAAAPTKVEHVAMQGQHVQEQQVQVQQHVAGQQPQSPAAAAKILKQRPQQQNSNSLHVVHTADIPDAQGQLVQQLLQQHSKLLDLLQIMANTAKASAERAMHWEQQAAVRHKTDSAPSTIAKESAATGMDAAVGSDSSFKALQDQYESQIVDNHQLKKRFVKVQKVLLQHLQEARLQAAAAEAGRDEANRREQEATSTSAALQMQLLQQQHDLQVQQQELSSMRDQLEQVKGMHKQKIQQIKQQLHHQYEAQLHAATAAYAQELAHIQSQLSYSRKSAGLRSSTTQIVAALAAAAAAASGESPQQSPGKHKQQHTSNRESLQAMLQQQVAKVQQQHLRRQQHRQQQHSEDHNSGSSSPDLSVPAEVVQYAEQYQQGVEGSVRPSTAAPSVLQRQRQKEQPVPEVAAQLAQHFVTGGEGISRPLTAPSSDRYGLMPQQHHRSSCSPRSSRPSLRNSCELPVTAATSASAGGNSCDMPSFILASNSLWDTLCE